MNSISFTLRDEEPIRARALSQAAAEARANAEAIAKALNVRVVGVLEAEPAETSIVRPLPREQTELTFAKAQSMMPIESGTLEIRAIVTVKLEIE